MSARWGRVGAGIAAPPTAARVWRRELARLEKLGYGSVWLNEGIGGREIFSQLGLVLAATDRLVAASGVANIWARQAPVLQAGAATLAEAYPGRVALGLGVSHPSMVAASGQTYGRPLAQMRGYLDRMDASADQAITPEPPAPRLLAALGPKMLALAAERADGAYPHTMPVAATTLARRLLGPDKLLVVGLGVLPEDPREALSLMRMFRLPDSPYVANLRRLGYPDAELGPEPSERVIGDIFAVGDRSAVATRVREHLAAGADHVVLQPVAGDLESLIDRLDELAIPQTLA